MLLLLLLSRVSRVRPHRRQPTRLPRPWDSPGKNTGVLPFLSPMHESGKWKWSWTPVSDSATPLTAAYQALPSMAFSRREHWSGLRLPSPQTCWSRGKMMIKRQNDEEPSDTWWWLHSQGFLGFGKILSDVRRHWRVLTQKWYNLTSILRGLTPLLYWA